MTKKEWKEKIKLDKRNKYMITFYIAMTIFEIIVAFKEKNPAWILCALLWFDIATMEYCNSKLLKGKEEVNNFQRKVIDTQHSFIIKLKQKIEQIQNTRIVRIDEIKVSKKFKKPEETKMQERLEYFNNFKKFKKPIVINKQNILIDGYTSYLIAKENGFNAIEVRKES